MLMKAFKYVLECAFVREVNGMGQYDHIRLAQYDYIDVSNLALFLEYAHSVCRFRRTWTLHPPRIHYFSGDSDTAETDRLP